MHTLSGLLIGRAILSLCGSQCSEVRRQWVQCGETGFAPETLQNIPMRDCRLAGWMAAGKQAKQQTTTPALHNSYREREREKKKTKQNKTSILKKGINPCHIMPVISDNSASNSEYNKGSIMLSAESRSAESIKVFGDNFTGSFSGSRP